MGQRQRDWSCGIYFTMNSFNKNYFFNLKYYKTIFISQLFKKKGEEGQIFHNILYLGQTELIYSYARHINRKIGIYSCIPQIIGTGHYGKRAVPIKTWGEKNTLKMERLNKINSELNTFAV